MVWGSFLSGLTVTAAAASAATTPRYAMYFDQ